jgi:rhamnogalacturonyl hydrolase YesR
MALTQPKHPSRLPYPHPSYKYLVQHHQSTLLSLIQYQSSHGLTFSLTT